MERLSLTEKRQIKERERYHLTGEKFAVELVGQIKAWEESAMPGYSYYPHITEVNQILGRARILDENGAITVIALVSSEWYPWYLHEGPKAERYTGPLSLRELLPTEDNPKQIDLLATLLLEAAERAEYSKLRRAPELDLSELKLSLSNCLIKTTA